MEETIGRGVPGRVLVMDSGLGGLATVAQLAARHPAGLHLVFFNALYD